MLQTINTLPYWVQISLVCVPVIAAMFAGFGLFLNAAQSRRTNSQARASIVNECLNKFSDDADMHEIFYCIEYSEFEYDPDTFHRSLQEKQLDKLLMHFSTVALSWNSGLLNIYDLQPLQYFVRRFSRNMGVNEYIHNVIEFSSRAGLGHHPYVSLLKMANELESDN